jgi:hypothetical protein
MAVWFGVALLLALAVFAIVRLYRSWSTWGERWRDTEKR